MAQTAGIQELAPAVDPQLPGLLTIYRNLHEHPELSHQEQQTSAFLATSLRQAGYTVTERVGKYTDGTQAFGVVAVLENGPGPTVLIRTDMDALPVEEKTGLPFASNVHAKTDTGDDVAVMHACGHDIHMTTFLGTARTLAQLKSRWHGKLILVGQPSEERVDGARALLADGLYARAGKPDFALAIHDDATFEAGKVAVIGGPVMAAGWSVDVTIRGVGGHGARPETTKDPVVMAAQFVTMIQTIVSRHTPPQQAAVVTVGSIHGGTRRNIIPDDVKMLLTIRSFSDQVQENIVTDIRNAARGVAMAAGVPDSLAPIITVHTEESVPVTLNDPAMAARIKTTLVKALGAANVLDNKPEMVSEDFGLYGLADHQIPVLLIRVGAVAPDKVAESRRTGQALPSLHSSLFAPAAEPTIRTGILSMTATVLELMK